jgi:hypothetical protein
MSAPESEARAALAWITATLRALDVPFQITGGLAARCYGSTRPLADIDIDVPEEHLPMLGDHLASYAVFGPARYRDDSWDLLLLTLRFGGQPIDLGGAYQTRVFDRSACRWVPAPANLETSVPIVVMGVEVPVVARADLASYKRRLARSVDREDLLAIGPLP